MIYKAICCCAVVAVFQTIVVADDPTPTQNPKKQRVSPKVLREVLSLPEYASPQSQVTTAEAKPVPTLDDLKLLAEKLKKDGNNDGAELLARFVEHQQKQARESQTLSATPKERLTVNVKIVEMKASDLEKHTDSPKTVNLKELATEVDSLIKSQKAEVTNSITIQTTEDDATTCHISNGLVPVPVPDANGSLQIEQREYGTVLELLPKLTANDRVSLRLVVETQEKDPTNAITLNGTTIPGVNKRRAQTTCEMNLGESFAFAAMSSSATKGAGSTNGRRVVYLTKVTKEDVPQH